MSLWQKIQDLQQALDGLGARTSIHVSVYGPEGGTDFSQVEADAVRDQFGASDAQFGHGEGSRFSWLDIRDGDICVTVFFDATKKSAAAGNSGE